MAKANMNKYCPDNEHIEAGKTGYYAKETLNSASNGTWYMIPIGVSVISVILATSGGSGKVQATNDWAAIEADTTPADIIDWDNGVVSASASSLLSPVVAVRQVNVSGTTVLSISAQ